MLYGRDPERARIGGLLEAARASRSAALVLRGEAGIGKSALLEDARERAGDMYVLAARGVESEAELPFAGLHQLLLPALPHVERLPPPQAAALRSALGLEEAMGTSAFSSLQLAFRSSPSSQNIGLFSASLTTRTGWTPDLLTR